MMSLFSQPKGSRPVYLRKSQIRDAHQTAGCNLIRQQDLSIIFFSKTTSGGMESRAAREGDYVISIQLCESCESED